MASTPTVYSLALLSEYTHTLDSLPLDLSRNFADLRELDAVLSSSITSLITKVQTLTSIIENNTPSTSKEERLWMLNEIAEEASRLKLGGEDKIRVACQAADNLKSHTNHLSALLENIPGFDPTTLIRKTTYPHVSARSFMPVHPDGGRRRRGGFSSLMHSDMADPSAAKRKRVTNRDDDLERSPRKERTEVGGSSRARNGARNRRAASPTESVLSVSSHLPNQTTRNSGSVEYQSNPSQAKKRFRNNASNITNNINQHYIAHENGFTNCYGGVPPLSSSAAHPSLPAAPLHHNGNGIHQYDVKGAEWIPPAPNQLAGPGMPLTRGSTTIVASTNAPSEIDDPGDADEVDDTRYCICKGLSYGEMIACDDDTCETEWFHYGCIGLIEPPEGKWYCDACLSKQNKRSGRGGKRKANNRSSRAKDND